MTYVLAKQVVIFAISIETMTKTQDLEEEWLIILGIILGEPRIYPLKINAFSCQFFIIQPSIYYNILHISLLQKKNQIGDILITQLYKINRRLIIIAIIVAKTVHLFEKIGWLNNF